MQCTCGSELTSSSHEVKTIKKAQEWATYAQEHDLPLRVEQDSCPRCGRNMWLARNKAGIMLEKKL
jgi:ribosomal protein S27AE